MNFNELVFESCLDKLNSFRDEVGLFFEPFKVKLDNSTNVKWRLDRVFFNEWRDRYGSREYRYIQYNNAHNITLNFCSVGDGLKFNLFNSLSDSERFLISYANDNVVRSLDVIVNCEDDFKDVVFSAVSIDYCNIISEYLHRDGVVCNRESARDFFGCELFDKFFIA